MKLIIILSDFTPVVEATEEEIANTPILRHVVDKPLAPTLFHGAVSKAIRTALSEVLYGVKGVRIQEDEIEMLIGEGSDTSTYLVKRPIERSPARSVSRHAAVCLYGEC